MVVRPTCISFGKSEEINIETLETLKIVLVVLRYGRMGETFNILEEKSDGASVLLNDWISIGSIR